MGKNRLRRAKKPSSLCEEAVILSEEAVILSKEAVILSEAKDLWSSAKCTDPSLRSG
jgi:hypothetical protein